MLLKLVLLLILTPLVELTILVYLGTVIGIWYTLLIVVATGLVGGIMARNQGLVILSRTRSSIERGIIPSNEVFDGALIVAGGLLLLTPGILTDTVGFVALIPQTRRGIRDWLRKWIQRRIDRGGIHYWELG